VGREQVGCVAKTHRDAERCVIARSTHPIGSRPSPAGARPGSTPRWNQGDPPCSFPAWPPGPRQGWAAGSDRFWLCELRVSQHFSTFYGSSVQSLDTQLGARDRRRTLTIQRGGAQRTLSAGSWFEQGLLAHQSTAVNRSRTQSRTTAGLPGRPACVSTRAGFSRCFPIGCRPLFKLFGGDLGADGRRDLEDVLDLIIGQVGVDQLLHRWQKHRAVERLQFGGDLLVERRGGERLLLGCRALLRCPGIGWGSRTSPGSRLGLGRPSRPPRYRAAWPRARASRHARPSRRCRWPGSQTCRSARPSAARPFRAVPRPTSCLTD